MRRSGLRKSIKSRETSKVSKPSGAGEPWADACFTMRGRWGLGGLPSKRRKKLPTGKVREREVKNERAQMMGEGCLRKRGKEQKAPKKGGGTRKRGKCVRLPRKKPNFGPRINDPNNQ